MGSATKITLSAKELSLVTDPAFILTKRAIIEKVYELFARNIEVIKSEFESAAVKLPVAVASGTPKISKGENYRQLPYVMLDFPRCFSGNDVFALRTLFWWGHCFSITLHLSGIYLDQYREIVGAKLANHWEDLYICVNEDQWEHHFNPDNYRPLEQLTAAEKAHIIEGQQFLKLALKFDLQQWNQMEVLLRNGYRKMAALLA